MVSTCFPSDARQEDRLILVVLFPTPPFWFATAIILPIYLISFPKQNSTKQSTLFSMQVFCMYISSSVVQFLISFSYKIRTIIFESENWNNYNTIQNTILRFFNVSRETIYCEMYFPIFFILCFLN